MLNKTSQFLAWNGISIWRTAEENCSVYGDKNFTTLDSTIICLENFSGKSLITFWRQKPAESHLSMCCPTRKKWSISFGRELEGLLETGPITMQNLEEPGRALSIWAFKTNSKRTSFMVLALL